MNEITKETFKEDIKKLVEVENQKQIRLAIWFENSLSNSKDIRITEFKDKLYLQANYYNTLEEHKFEIDNLVNMFKQKLDKLFTACSNRYMNIQKELASAVQSEIIVITNISINKENLEKAIENADSEKIRYYTNKINASIQKKLNYEVIINECNARLEKCIEQIEELAESVKIDEETRVVEAKKNKFVEFLTKIINKINNKKNFRNFILQPSEKYLDAVGEKVESSLETVYTQICEFAIQMQDNKAKINNAYNAMLAA